MDIKKLKSILSIAGCAFVGIAAFVTEIDKKNTAKTVSDLVEKVAKLEGKES